MELKINEIMIPEKITFNYEELKGWITEKVHDYEVMVYTDDQIKAAKADRASLNKLKKALNDERLRREKEYMKPFTDFKAQINEIISIIDRPVAIIDQQVKEYEEKLKQAKMAEIQAYMENYRLPYGISTEKLFDPKWLNASVNMKTVVSEIEEGVRKVTEDSQALEELTEYQAEAIEFYCKTLDLAGALKNIRSLKEQKELLARIEAEAEKKRQEAAAAAPAPAVIPDPEPEKQPEAHWVRLAVNVTIDQSRKLKTFLDQNGIQYKAI